MSFLLPRGLASTEIFGLHRPRSVVRFPGSKPAGPLSKGMLSLGGYFFLCARVPSWWPCASISRPARVKAMKYAKPALSFEEQADLLLQRGMVGDRDEMIRRLARVSYYRLSGYSFPFRQSDNTFRPGTTFRVVWDHYVFDRKLRLLLLDAIERIEIGLRTSLSYHQGHDFGPFGYMNDAAALPKLDSGRRNDLLTKVQLETDRNHKEQFVAHFVGAYGDHHHALPIWMATEVLSFGTVLSLWQASPNKLKRETAKVFGVSDDVLKSWFWTLNEVRNVCAHHSRLWNRLLGNKPMIPAVKHHPDWHEPVAIRNDRLFIALTICQFCLHRLSPGSTWASRLRDLFDGYPGVPKRHMGIPDKWLDCPIWKAS